jgi:DNA-binding transcriptional LysR family regulator
MELEIRHVRLFLVLAEELHFSRAAARLALPQPALSQQLGRMERALGVRLFERTTRTVTLTDAGRELLPAARAADAAMRRLAELAEPAVRQPQVLRMVLGSPRTGRLVEQVQERFPWLSVRHAVMVEDAAVPAFTRGEFDVLFAAEQASEPFSFGSRMRVATILEEPVWITLPRHHPLAALPPVHLADLAKEAWVEYPKGTFEHDFLLTICGEAGFTPDIRHVATDRQVVCDLLEAGVCICVTSPSVPPKGNCVILPLHPVIMRRFVLAWDPAHCPDAVAQLIMTYMRCFYRGDARANPHYWSEIVADPHRYRLLYPLENPAG